MRHSRCPAFAGPRLAAAVIAAALLFPSLAARGDGRQPYPADALVFLSTAAIDRILSAADDTEYRVAGIDGLGLRLVSLRTAFTDRPGLLRAVIDASLPDDPAAMRLTATGRLLAERAAPDGRLLLRPRLTTLVAEDGGDGLDDALRAIAIGSVSAGLNALADSAPALDFNLQRLIELTEPARQYPLSFQLGGARVEASLHAPAFRLQWQVATQSLHYGSRGLVALLSVSAPAGNGPPTAPAPHPGGVDPASLQSLVPPGQDAYIHIQGTSLARLAASLNRLPPQSRTLGLTLKRSRGTLFSRKRLGLGCGSNARLAPADGLLGGFALGPIASRWQGGRLALALPLWVDLQAHALVRVKGFPAPCGLTSPRPRCRCARGKTGFGVRSRMRQAIDLAAEAAFGEAADGGVEYRLLLRAPRRLQIEPRLSLGRLGSLPIPVEMPMPVGEMARGRVPLLLDQAGRIHLGIPPSVIKDYQLRLTNSLFQADGSGLAAGFALSIDYRDPPPVQGYQTLIREPETSTLDSGPTL